MGMFDTIFLKGKLRELVGSNLESNYDHGYQTKDMDLALCSYIVGDDLKLKVDENPWERWTGEEYFELVKAGKYTGVVECYICDSKYSMVFGFINNKLQFIANIKVIGWLPLENSYHTDKFIVFDQTTNEPTIVELEHDRQVSNQLALNAYHTFSAFQIGDGVSDLPLYKALINYYHTRKFYLDNKTTEHKLTAFKSLMSSRSTLSEAFAKYSKVAGFTGITDMLSPMAIIELCHQQWVLSQNYQDNEFKFGPYINVDGFDHRYPSHLLHIFESSWKDAFGLSFIPQNVRPNLDFGNVTYITTSSTPQL